MEQIKAELKKISELLDSTNTEKDYKKLNLPKDVRSVRLQLDFIEGDINTFNRDIGKDEDQDNMTLTGLELHAGNLKNEALRMYKKVKKFVDKELSARK